uniref:Uncharacterized protein n=1 Tax=Heterorhabditis bacteriophora TaxID=37862 RepID=A0A1I7WNL3_HETBA
MRRAAGVHVRSNKHRLGLLSNTAIEERRIPPSLRSDKKIMTNANGQVGNHEYNQLDEKVLPIMIVRRKVRHVFTHVLYCLFNKKTKRSTYNDESPRSGLRPSYTLTGTRSSSDYGIVTLTQRLAEQRKLSDYGVLPPVLVSLPTCESPKIDISSVREKSAALREDKINNWKITATTHVKPDTYESTAYPQQQNTYLNRLTHLRNNLSRPNMRKSSTTPPEIIDPTKVEISESVELNETKTGMKKSITFCETTKERFRRSMRRNSQYCVIYECQSQEMGF